MMKQMFWCRFTEMEIMFAIAVTVNILMWFGDVSGAVLSCDSNLQSSTITCEITSNTTTDFLNHGIDNLKNGRTFDNLHIRCPNESQILWNNSAFSDTFKSLKMEACVCETNDTRIQINGRNLQSLEFFKVNPEFFQYIEINERIQLSALTIDDCGITEIPEFVIQMDRRNLSKLFLKRNKITELNCELFKGASCLNKNCHLNLFQNEIVEIPDCVCKSSIIWYTINLYNNKINNVSNLNCTNQIHVDAQDNSIQELPIFTYDGTITYEFTFNKIKRIRRETFVASKLCLTISLSYNEIEVIEAGAFIGLKKLQILNLQSNRLKEFDVIHAPVGSMFQVNLNIKYNRLIHPPYTNGNYSLPQLVRTQASQNPYQCDCSITRFSVRYNHDRTLANKYPAPPSHPLLTSYTYITQIFVDGKRYMCDSPESVKSKPVVQLNTSSTCQVIRACPSNCTCTKSTALSKSTIVDCSSASLTELPRFMPSDNLHLDLSFNYISVLDDRDYLIRAISLNISHNEISHVNSGAVTLLQNVEFLDLSFNKLSTIPRSFEDTLFNKMASIFLSGNNWKCSCDNVWVGEWLSTKSHLISKDSNIECVDGSNDIHILMEVTSEVLGCIQTPINITILAVVLGCFILLLIALSIPAFIYRHEVRVLYYTRIKLPVHYRFHPSQKTYDAFISYSEHDRSFVTDLVNELENTVNMPYKICIHDRDFQVGSPIVENISSAINNSNVTIFVVSEHFIDSEWCAFEFKTAYQTMLQEQNTKILVIKLHDVDEEKLDENLRAYFRTKYYIDAEDKLFFDKLLYSLPNPNFTEEQNVLDDIGLLTK